MTDPLTGRTTSGALGEMAVALLAYANRAAVARALTERGYTVSKMQVSRWARGAEMPDIAARMIAELFRHDPDTTEEAAPPWVERLLGGVMALETEAELTSDALDEAVARAIAYLAVAPLRRHEQGGDGAGGASSA